MRHSTSAPTPLALRQARQQLIDKGALPQGAVHERIARSWQRSLAAGLMPVGRLAPVEHASGSELRQSLVRNHDLLAHSRPVMEFLFEQVRHIQSVVILADNRGTLMHTLGDPFFLHKADRVALSTGASWREEHRGTNAIGTAIAEERALEVHGAEHFLERNGFLTCAAAPILSSTGQMLGILDISGEQHHGHPMTLGLVSTAARMIENRLIVATCRQQVRLHLHSSPEGIGTVAEGIVALSEDGWIVGANRQALALMRLPAQAIGNTQIASVLDVRLAELFSRHQRRPGQTAQVPLHDGTPLYVQIQGGVPRAPAPATVACADAAARDALASLDTGDARWRSAADKARRVLDKPIPILIQGESGVGKEFFARAVHDSSRRATGPFVAINCAAIPENLIEAELFGYAPGAFTGARKEGSLGRLREASGGTLFLDEIGDMAQAVQARLLRVLQERCVTPLGGGKSFNVDFALVCATHRNLREAADSGAFRSDLFYRINGLTVQLPALRERTDFAALSERLLAGLEPGRGVLLAPDLAARLTAYAWPGNLRQLASVLRTACAMLDADEDLIELRHLPDDLAEALTAGPVLPASAWGPAQPHNLQALSRHAVQQALEASRGNISHAARVLGISRQTLYRKLRPP
ncbi:MAG: sigma-54-dependent Fis family transcriptional regulator [Rhodoferax sp.]|nr:sigma-54-dependent Fis family transcriptional regulator [Rhodoferax sp.]